MVEWIHGERALVPHTVGAFLRCETSNGIPMRVRLDQVSTYNVIPAGPRQQSPSEERVHVVLKDGTLRQLRLSLDEMDMFMRNVP